MVHVQWNPWRWPKKDILVVMLGRRGEDRIKGGQGHDGGSSLCTFLINILCFCAMWKQYLFKNEVGETSLVIHWLRTRLEDFPGDKWIGIHLPAQGTRARSLACEDPTCHGAAKPVHHDYWSPHTQTPVLPQQEKTRQRETRASQLQSHLRWPQLGKACRKQWRPRAVKNKYK